MSDRYQVTAECAYVTVDTLHGRVKTLVYRDAFVPADAPELRHLLDSGMAAKVGGPDTAPDTKPATETPSITGGSAETPSGDEPDADVEAKRAEARAKLAELGGTPDGRSSEAVWVEYAVAQGLSREEAEKAGKTELIAALRRGK